MQNIIFLVNIKNPTKPERTSMYDVSVLSWKLWAERNKCGVVVLSEPVADISLMNPILMRHYVFELLDHSAMQYDQICMVDADTIVHPDCPNFFEMTDHKFCAVHNDGDYDWVIRSIENYQYEFYPDTPPTNEDVWNYFNTGFMITNAKYRSVHEELIKFYWQHVDKIRNLQQKYGVGTDQPLLNMFVRNNDIDVKLLPYQFNMQDLARKNILDERMLFTKIPGVYHFNAMPGGPEQVNYWLTKTLNYFYDC